VSTATDPPPGHGPPPSTDRAAPPPAEAARPSDGPRGREYRFPLDDDPRAPGPYRLLFAGRRALVQRFRAGLRELRAAQEARLHAVLAATAGSAFARDHGLERVRSLADLRAAVPVRAHAELRPWLDRIAAGERAVLTRAPVLQLLETSGTTGAPKHLPVTAEWARGVADAQALWVLSMIKDHPEVTRTRALTMVSPAVHSHSPGGLPIGSNTGRMQAAQPWYVRARYPIPARVYGLTPDPLKWYCLLRFALQADIGSITTANPSTVLLLCRRLQQWREELSADLADGTLRRGPAAELSRGARFALELRLRRRPPPADWAPARLWPLGLINCWKGGPAAFFVDRLAAALGGPVPVREVGITASEGFFAIPLGDDWPGGVVWPLGHLLEFIGDDGETRGAWELDVGEQVRLVVSTEAGLLRYDLADTLEVVGRCEGAPVLRFVGKSGRWLNATGEKLTEAQVSAAMSAAAAGLGLAPVGFTAVIEWAEVPRLGLAVEGAPVDALPALARAFDAALRAQNVEYEGRRSSERLGEVAPLCLPAGTYAAWRARRVADGAPDGQVKDPIIAATEVEWARVLAARDAAGGPA